MGWKINDVFGGFLCHRAGSCLIAYFFKIRLPAMRNTFEPNSQIKISPKVFNEILIALTLKDFITFWFAYSILVITSLLIGLYQSINIEVD